MRQAIVILSTLTLSATAAMAQTSNEPANGVQLSQSECTSLWDKASAGSKTLTQAQAKPYISDFSAVNADNDGSIDQNEFMAACNKGLVHSSSASGASSGTSGKANPAEHAPTNRMDSVVPKMTPPEK